MKTRYGVFETNQQLADDMRSWKKLSILFKNSHQRTTTKLYRVTARLARHRQLSCRCLFNAFHSLLPALWESFWEDLEDTLPTAGFMRTRHMLITFVKMKTSLQVLLLRDRAWFNVALLPLQRPGVRMPAESEVLSTIRRLTITMCPVRAVTV
jgi:hypothetical protein